MKKILDLIHELRCDINYCKVSGNETEIKNANETLSKLESSIKNSLNNNNSNVQTTKQRDDYESNLHRHWIDEDKNNDDDHGGTIKHFRD